jgi:hypothetical protein
MEKQILLKEFQYSIPPSSLVKAALKKNPLAVEHLSLMHVNIDFENGRLQLEGDWKFMMASNKYNEGLEANCSRQRVKIEMFIYPATVINLNDPFSDGLIFPLEGIVKDGNCKSSCSGMVILDNIFSNDGSISNRWNISFYIYDLEFDCYEIKFKLPYYPGKCTPYLN